MGFGTQLAAVVFAAALASCELTQGSASPPMVPAQQSAGVGVRARPDLPEQRLLSTGTIVPAKHHDGVPCSPFHEGDGAVCVGGFDGPMIITDIVFGAACPDELLLMVGGIDQPTWYLLNPPRSAVAIHGAELRVQDTDGIVFAARPATKGTPLTATSECSITWSRHWP